MGLKLTGILATYNSEEGNAKVVVGNFSYGTAVVCNNPGPYSIRLGPPGQPAFAWVRLGSPGSWVQYAPAQGLGNFRDKLVWYLGI